MNKEPTRFSTHQNPSLLDLFLSSNVDELFMTYKTERDPGFRYLVKSGLVDIEVLCKTENSGAPYRRIDLGLLGAVPDLKTVTPNSRKPDVPPTEFTRVSRKSKKRGKHVPQDRIFRRIDNFIKMIEPMSEEDVSNDEDES